MDWKIWLVAAGVMLAFFLLKRASFVSAEKAEQSLRDGALVIDVRSPGEFNSGHLRNAVNIPLGELSSELPRRVPDKSKVLLLHCLSGARSGMAQRQAKNMGYTAFNLGSYGRAESIVGKSAR